MNEKKNVKQNERKLSGRKNPTDRRQPDMESLPIGLEQKGKDQPLSFDLNKMPHLSITGGTLECQASVIRKILEFWASKSSIEPEVLDLAGTLNPETPAISEGMFISKLYEMLAVLERRYDELAKQMFKNAREYLDHGHNDMPFRPIILFGFEKMSGSQFREDAEKLLCKLAQKGRAAGIDLILCSTDAKMLKGVIDCNFPAKLIFRSNDEKDFSWKSPF